jgi:hypothetical protein
LGTFLWTLDLHVHENQQLETREGPQNWIRSKRSEATQQLMFDPYQISAETKERNKPDKAELVQHIKFQIVRNICAELLKNRVVRVTRTGDRVVSECSGGTLPEEETVAVPVTRAGAPGNHIATLDPGIDSALLELRRLENKPSRHRYNGWDEYQARESRKSGAQVS